MKERSFNAERVLLIAACLVIVIAGMKAAQTILIPFTFAVFLSLLAGGPIVWLSKKGLPNFLSITLVTAVIILLFSLLSLLLVASINEFTAELPTYRKNLQIVIGDLEIYLAQYKIDAAKIIPAFNPGDYLVVFTKTLKGAVQAVSGFVIVLIMMIFMVIEGNSFRKKFDSSLGDQFDISKFTGVAIDVERYLVIKTFTSFITGLAVGLLTYFMEMDFPLLWGLVAFLLNYVPFIGSIIAAIPAILVSLVMIPLSNVLLLIAGYLAINIGISNFLEPVLMGKRLGLSVLIVFLSLMFWGWVWGPAGALMSVPLTMIVKIIFEHSPQLSWVSTLMGTSRK